MATSRNAVRSFLRTVRRLPDRLLHPIRRRRAVASVRAIRPVQRILVLCLGNICRSPYAAAALRRELAARSAPEGAEKPPFVDSAGFIRPGRPSPSAAREVAARNGLELSGHRSRLLESEELSRVDLVLVMDTRQRAEVRRLEPGSLRPVVLLGDLDPRPIAVRRIPDPVERPEAVFVEVYGRIDRCVRVLADALVAGGSAGREEE